MPNNNQPPKGKKPQYNEDFEQAGYGSNREYVERNIAQREYNRKLQAQKRYASQQASQITKGNPPGTPPSKGGKPITSIQVPQSPVDTGFRLDTSLGAIGKNQANIQLNLTKPGKAVSQKTAQAYKATQSSLGDFTVPSMGVNYNATKVLAGQTYELASKLVENPIKPDKSVLTKADKNLLEFGNKYYKQYYNALDPKATGWTRIKNVIKMNDLRAGSEFERTVIGQVSRVLDVPDFIQSMTTTPHQNSLKDWGYSIMSGLNDAYYGTQDILEDIGSLITTGETYKKKNPERDKQWAKNNEAIQKRALANKEELDQLIKNGQYESSKAAWYNSSFMGSVFYNLPKIGNKIGAAIDPDEGMDNWASKAVNERYAVAQEQMAKAAADREKPKLEAEIKRAQDLILKREALKAEQGTPSNPERLQLMLDKAREIITNKRNAGSLIKKAWDEDKRSATSKGWDQLTGQRQYLNYDGSAEAFAQHFTSAIVQGGTQIVTTMLLSKGMGAAGNLVTKGATAAGKGIAATKLGTKVGSGLAKVGQTKTVTKGYSLLTDAMNPVKSMFNNAKKQLQAGRVDPKFAPLGKAPKSNLGSGTRFTALLAFDESQQIGIDVYNRSLDSGMERKLGFTKQDFFNKYTPENGESFTAEETAAMERDWDNQVESFAKANPKDFSSIVKKAATAGQIAASTNFVPELAGTMLMFKKFGYFKPKKLVTRAGKRTYITANNVLTRGAVSTAKEGFLEEGGSNMYSEKLGEAYGEDKAYSLLSDFIDRDFGSAENLENILKGMAGSLSTTSSMEVLSGKSAQEIQMFKNKLKFAKDMKELSGYTGRNELANFIKNSLQLENQAEFEARQKVIVAKHQALAKELKKGISRSEKKRIVKEMKAQEALLAKEERAMFSTQVNNAIHAGRVDTYIQSLDTMVEKAWAEGDEDAVEELEGMIATVKEMESVYVRHQNLKGSGKIISNRFNVLSREQQIKDIDSELAELRPSEDAAIERQARIRTTQRAVSPRANAKTGMPKKGTFVQSMYDEMYESVLAEVREQASKGDDLGEADLKSKNILRAERAAAQKELDALEMTYQELVSDEYQEKYEDQIAFKQDLSKSLNTLKEEKHPKAIADIRKKYSKVFTPAQLDAMENEIQMQYKNIKEYRESLAAEEAAESARLEAEKLKKAEEEVKAADKAVTTPKPSDTPVPVSKIEKDEKLASGTAGITPLTSEERNQKEGRLAELKAMLDKDGSGPILVHQEINQLEDELGDNNFKDQADDAFGTVNPEKEVENEVQENPEENFDNKDEEVPTETAPGGPAVDLSKLILGDEIESILGGPITGTVIPAESLPYAPVMEDQETFKPIDTRDEDDVYSPSVNESGRLTEEVRQKQKDAVEVATTRAAIKYGKSVTQITPQDVMQYFMEVQGLPFIQAKWDAIADAYKMLNPDDTTDFEKLYVKMFDNPNDLYNDAFGGVEETPSTSPTPSTTTSTTTSTTGTAPVNKNDLPTTDNPIRGSQSSEVTGENEETKSTNIPDGEETVTYNDRVLRSSVRLSLKHLTNVFSRELLELNKHLVDFKKFFDFKTYEDAKSNEIDIEFSIPENYWDYHIFWNPRNDKVLNVPISFRKWEDARKKGKGLYGSLSLKGKMQSEEWLTYVPIVGKDKDGNVVMVLNNGDYGTSMDILDFLKDMPEEERDLYRRFANEANMKIRKAIAAGNNTPVKAKVKTNLLDRGNNSKTEVVWKLDSNGNPEEDERGYKIKKTIPVEPKTLSSEPQSSFDEKRIMIGVYNPKEDPENRFQVDGKPVKTVNTTFDKFDEKRNKTVIIRQIGVNPDGSPVYLAMTPDMVKVNRVHAQSIIAAIRAYLLKDNSLVDQTSTFKQFVDNNKEIFDFKLHNQLRAYVLSFIQENPWAQKATADKLTDPEEMQKSFAAWLNSVEKNKAAPGQVSIAFVNFKVVIATKPLDGSPIKEEDILVLDPRDFEDTKLGQEHIVELIKNLGKVRNSLISNPNSLSRSKYTAATGKKFYVYGVTAKQNPDGSTVAEEFIEEYENYDEFSKQTIYIPGGMRSMTDPATNSPISTREDGTEFTTPYKYYSLEVSSPVIDETLGEMEEKEKKAIEEKNIKEDVKETIRKKNKEEKKKEKPKEKPKEKSKEEEDLEEKKVEVKADEVMKKIKTLEATKARFVAMGDSVNAAKIAKTILDLRTSLEKVEEEDDDDFAFSPKVVTPQVVEKMQELSEQDKPKLEGITISQKNQMVDNIYHRVARAIGYKQGSKISKARILKSIKDTIFSDINKSIEENTENIEGLRELEDPTFQPFIDTMLEKNRILENLKENWGVIEEEVIQTLERKAGIKEIRDTTTKIEDENYTDDTDDSDNTADNPDSSDAVTDTTEVDEREKSFNSALEVKGKLTGSDKMKRFLTGIPVMIRKGTEFVEAMGYLGQNRYHSFEELDNLLKVGLNSPREIASSYPDVIAKLREIGQEDGKAWANVVADRLENEASEQARIEFLYNYTGRHALSSKYVEFSETKGGFTTKVNDANFTDVAKNIRLTWKNGVKTEGIIYDTNEEGEYIPNMSVVDKLISDFENIIKLSYNRTPPKSHILNYIPNAYLASLRGLAPGEAITIPAGDWKSHQLRSLDKAGTFPTKISYGKLVTLVAKNRDGDVTFTREAINQNQVTALSNWLVEVGLDINAATLTELVNNGFSLGKKGSLRFEELIDPEKLEGPFVNIYTNLKAIKHRHEVLKYPIDFESFSVLDNMNQRLDNLAQIEAKYTSRVITKNFKDNGKLISGLPVGKFATDRVGALKGYEVTDENGVTKNVSPIRSQLLNTRFNRNSLLLSILEDPNEDLFREIFKIHHVAVGSLKGKYSKFAYRAKVTQLSPRDLEIAKLAHFHELNNVPKFNTRAVEGFSSEGDVRMGNVFLPTMSDKDQMMVLQTLLFNMAPSDLENGKLSERFLNLLYSQLVNPEIERMHDFHIRRKASPTTITGYEEGAQLFNFISSLNNFKVDGVNNLTTMLKNNPEDFTPKIIESTYGPDIKKEINEFILALTAQKRAEWKSLNITTNKGKSFINASYLSNKESAIGKKNKEDVLDNIAMEFVINNLITNANVHMMIIGDPALYSKKGPLKPENFHTDLNGKLDVTRPKDESKAYELYRDWAENGLGTNLGKRLALMLAPGNKIFNSKNEKFQQIFLEDSVQISEALADLVATQFGEEYREEMEGYLEDIKAFNEELSNNEKTKEERAAIEKAKKEILDIIRSKFGSVADYTKIEATDAQEYTTTAEHLHVLRGQGRLSDEIYEIVRTKLAAQEEDMKKSGKVSSANYLTTEELKTVFQPFKPVYTGQQYDEAEGVMRTVYNKTSSFPLIPQLTAGKALDGLRVSLETYENYLKTKDRKAGSIDFVRGVRATHGSGAKVGSSTLAISPFKPNGDFNAEALSIENIDKAAITLDRDSFRIQQDVPYKSGKTKEDTIKYGTQMLKLLFSNGIADSKVKFDNPDANKEGESETISGQELLQKFNDTFGELVEVKKAQLFKELGLKSNGTGSTLPEFKKKVEKLLQNEGMKRDYNPSDLKALRLDEGGEFIMPLYLNSQASRIETLLLSIVIKRTLEHKLPGYSYVAGSEVGFKFVEDANLVPGADRVIYLNGFEKTNGILKGRTRKNLAQVMVPSKIRDNDGKLLDLYQKDNAGRYVYLSLDKNNRYVLKPNMMEEVLKNFSTFRIPSSSHVSLSQVEIVGILPPESGDLIIVPKDFTKQKGLDYDVDKENAYHLWTYITKNGQIREFSQDRADYLVDNFIKRHEYKLKKIEEKNLESLANELDEEYNSYSFEEELEAVFGSKQELKSFDELNADFEDKLESFKLRLRQKLAENKIIKIHSSVLGNQSPEVQKKITKVLSMDFATEQAEKITALKALGDKTKFLSKFNIQSKETALRAEAEFTKDARHFSILSDAYQTKKMFLGSAGQSGISVYSNFLTMSALMQQYSSVTDFYLRDTSTKLPLQFSIAGQEVIAKLGRIKTLDGGRTISEVFEELQNTATDNEKEQIMGRTGINNSTIAVFSLMNALGIDKTQVSSAVAEKYGIQDKDSTEDLYMSFGNLLLSQDIVTEFTARLDLAESSTTEISNTNALDIVNLMIADIVGENDVLPDVDEEENLLDYTVLSGDNLVASLAKDLPKDKQALVNYQTLNMMKMFMEYGDTIRNAQKVLGMASQGMGLDLIEANNNSQLLAEIATDASLSGFSALLYRSADEHDPKKMYIDRIGYVVPTTPLGHSLLESYRVLGKTWARFYPYTDPNSRYSGVVEHALANTTIRARGKKKIEFERAFNKDFKRYLYAENMQDTLYEGDLEEERETMFFDTPGKNESLASYIKRLLNDETLDEEILKNLKNNPLLRKLTFDIHKNSAKNLKKRRPSVVKYDITNASQENEDALHGSLVELIEADEMLVERNGQPYTSRDLARDLILAAYLEGGVQEVHQYVKYIPLPYLQAMGFTTNMQRIFLNLNAHFNIPQSPGKKSLPNTFVRQFFQHNPKFVRQLEMLDGESYTDLKKNEQFDVTVDEEFTFDRDTKIRGNFFTIKDPDIMETHKLALFERVPDTNTFRRIDTVGFYGMHEYNPSIKRLTGMKHLKAKDPFEKPAPKAKKAPGTKSKAKIEETTVEDKHHGYAISASGQMKYDYNGRQREEVTSADTFDAIINGERTATTRYESGGKIPYWEPLKEGDIIEWTAPGGRVLYTKVTKPLHKLSESGKTAEDWSKLEGWSVDYYNKSVKDRLDEAWQIEFEFIEAFDGPKKETKSKPGDKGKTSTGKQPVEKKKAPPKSEADLVTFGIRDEGSVREVVNNIMLSNTSAREILEPFSHMFGDNIKLVISEEIPGNGMYTASTNTVSIHPDVLKKDPEKIALIMAKELVHAATKNQIGKYVNDQGKFKLPEAEVPIYVKRLTVLYNELRSEGIDLKVQLTPDGPTLEEFLANYNPKTVMNWDVFESFYGFTNIHEFMEMALTEPMFRAYMDKLAKMNKKRSFTDRLATILKSLLKAVALQGNKSVSDQVVDATLELIFQENKIYSKMPGPVITQEVKNEITSRLKDFINPRALKYLSKEKRKSSVATQYIGIGAPETSTDGYRELYEEYGLANTGVYHSNDVVWVSSNGKQKGRVSPVNEKTGALSPEYRILRYAMSAGATIVMDTKAHLDNGTYNEGEKALAEYLEKNGWVRDPYNTEVGWWTREGDSNKSYSPRLQTLEDMNAAAEKLLKENNINMETSITEDPFKCG